MQLTQLLQDDAGFARWFGGYVTCPLRVRGAVPHAFFIASESESQSANARECVSESHWQYTSETEKDIDAEIHKNSKNDNNHDGSEDDLDTYDEGEDEDENGDVLPFAISGPYSVASTQRFNTIDEIIQQFISGNVSCLFMFVLFYYL